MLSLSYVKVCFPLVSDFIKLRNCGEPIALALYSSLIPVLIVKKVMCKACVPKLFVFNYIFAVLRGSLLLF